MHPKELQLGSVSAQTERTLLLALLLLAAGLRFLVWRTLPSSVTEIDSVAQEWTRVAAPLLGSLTALLLYRFCRQWLDLPSAMVATFLWAVVGWAVAAPAESWPEQLALPLLLLSAGQALSVAERRHAAGSWRLGAWLGVAAVLSGSAWIWLAALLAWLPTTSRRLRGVASMRLGAEVLGTMIVVPLLVSVAFSLLSIDQRVMADGDRVLAGLRGETLVAPFTRHDGASQAALDAWVGFEMAEADLATADHGLQREAAIQTLIWARGLEHPWLHLKVAGRRTVALVAGWPGLGSPALPLPTLPWTVVALAAWLGALALLPSARRYFPLLVAAAAPLLQAAACGITVASLVLALPFTCVLAGYGLQRISVGRASVSTWLMGAVVLAAAVLSHRMVAGWS